VKKLHFAVAAGIVASGCSSLSPSEDPVALRMQDMEARLIRIERVVENQSLVQLSSEVERLRAEASALRGELETLRFETENSDGRQRDLYVDVDRRLQSLEQAQRVGFAPPPATAPQSSAPSQSSSSQAPPVAAAPARPVGSDQQNYQAAFDLIQARKYPEAGTAFTKFLSDFPTSPLADNAQYWLAETRYVQRQFQSALPEFQKVVDNYPQSAKLPDALLKVGYCQIELGQREAARTALQQVMRQYPDTTAARLASQRLDRLSQEGG
jgi:tol-pal system protein YbgF